MSLRRLKYYYNMSRRIYIEKGTRTEVRKQFRSETGGKDGLSRLIQLKYNSDGTETPVL